MMNKKYEINTICNKDMIDSILELMPEKNIFVLTPTIIKDNNLLLNDMSKKEYLYKLKDNKYLECFLDGLWSTIYITNDESIMISDINNIIKINQMIKKCDIYISIVNDEMFIETYNYSLYKKIIDLIDYYNN